MMYDNGYFGGMHFFWWFIWIVMIIWIFATPYDIPYQRSNKETPLEILKKRYAMGEIDKQQYEDAKKDLKTDI